MSLIKCPECNNLISELEINCPNCDFPMSEELVLKIRLEEKRVKEKFRNKKVLETRLL